MTEAAPAHAGAPAAVAPAGAWSFACPDWEQRLRDGRSLVPPLPLDKAKADRAVAIFDNLRLPDVAGTPLLADAAGDWFRDIVRVAFGSLDDAGVRHVPEIFCLVGKKNSKTTNSGALILTGLLVNTVPRAEILFVGPTQEIADLAFAQAEGMIAADAEGFLPKRFHVRAHLKTIVDRVTGAFVKVKTFDMKVMTGSRPLIVLLDELHIMGQMHNAARVIGQIRGALQARRDSLLLIITTQSDEPPAGVFRAELQYARSVRDGRVTGSQVRMLPLLYEFPEAMQTDPAKPWADPRYWPMVMPNLGRSLHLDAMIAGYDEAREKGEEEERRWASQHLNVEIGLALHADRWRGADYWQAAAVPAFSLSELIARSEVVTVGIDGGGLDDLLGFAALGRERATRDWLLWTRAWAQDDVLSRRKDIAPRLEDFAAAGDLTICDRPTQDIEEVAELVAGIHAAGLLPARYGVGLDPVGVAAIVDALEARGIDTDENDGPVCAVSQGYRLSGAVWGMERKLKDGTLRHAGQALLAWCVGNAKTEQRGNAVLVTKQAAGKAKIDPLMAAFNAFSLMSRHPTAAGKAAPLVMWM